MKCLQEFLSNLHIDIGECDSRKRCSSELPTNVKIKIHVIYVCHLQGHHKHILGCIPVRNLLCVHSVCINKYKAG